MRISEVTIRSGISMTALRYYESIGLVTPRRTSNGYRDYDADVLSRLDLIEASKELGLPLADIGRHLQSLEADSCTDVRDQLQPLLVEQTLQLDQKLTRLGELRTRLGRAEHDLVNCPDRTGHCSTECILQARIQSAALDQVFSSVQAPETLWTAGSLRRRPLSDD